MKLKTYLFLFIVLVGFCCGSKNLDTCPAENGNSSVICNNEFEACCDNECKRINDAGVRLNGGNSVFAITRVE